MFWTWQFVILEHLMILVGSYAYLKNFRKGLRYQRERCLHAATDAGDVATASELNDRVGWTLE